MMGSEGVRGGGSRKEEIPSIVVTGRGRGPRHPRHEGFQHRRKDTLSSKHYSYSESDHSNFISLPEDSRISATLRRMLREEDETKFLNLCKHLQDSVGLLENSAYIRRSLDMILDSLLELMRTGPSHTMRAMAAKCLGHVGYNLEKDFKRFMDWVFTKYSNESEDEVKTLLMKGILEATQLDYKSPKLMDFAPALMAELQQAMELTEVGDIFIATAEVILVLTRLYPDTFTEYFRDTIDIIVGWHIESSQPAGVIKFASGCLKQLSVFWQQDMAFTVTLLTQFLEDAENYVEELALATDTEKEEAITKITSFIRVFNSVFKGLGSNMEPTKSPAVTWEFLCDSLTKVLNTVVRALDITINQPLLIAGNKCASIIINILQSKTSLVQGVVCKYIDLQLEKGFKLSEKAIVSLLRFISKVVEVLDMRLSNDMADKLFSRGCFLLSLRFSQLQGKVLLVYHTFLRLKNIPLLKHAYNHMLWDLEVAVKAVCGCEMDPLIPGSENLHRDTKYTEVEANEVVMFTFRALADRANKSNSLICLWLLQPSIFDLLAIKLLPVLSPLKQPTIHYSLLFILRSHCVIHDQFILSSGLLSTGMERAALCSLLGLHNSSSDTPTTTISPTTSYFQTVINLLGESLKREMGEESKLLVLSWCKSVLKKGKPYTAHLMKTREFEDLVEGLCLAASDTCVNVAHTALLCLHNLLRHYSGVWPPELAFKLLNLCLYYVNSNHAELREKYRQIFTMLPAMLVVFNIGKTAMESESLCRKLILNQYSQMLHGDTGVMQPIHFRLFMAYLLQGYQQESVNDWLREVVTRCWSVLESEDGSRAINQSGALMDWSAWHAAQLCVDLRLRTPLGKPLDTFITIEGALRSLAQETITHVVTKGTDNRSKKYVTINRARLLIKFIEQLEKAIYNAAEGTSSAIPPPTKSVKTFFLTNKSTCYEWLARIRLAVLVVCLHCGLASSAIRHGYALLQTMLDNDNAQGSEFESTLLHVGWGLATLGEAEAVQGLYAWARDTARQKHPALKPLTEQAARRYEAAAEGYKNLVENNLADSPSCKSEETDGKTNQTHHSVRTFIADQLTECYLALNNWEELESWKAKEEEFLVNENGGSAQRLKYIKSDYVQALKLFESGEYVAASSLLNWECPDLETLSNKTKWESYNILNETNYMLTNIAVTMGAQYVPATNVCCLETIERCKEVIDHLISEGVRDTPSEILSRAAILKYVAASLTAHTNLLDEVSESLVSESDMKSPEMGQVLWWTLALNSIQQKLRQSSNITQFTLQVAKCARKEGNLKFSERALKTHLKMVGLAARSDSSLAQLSSALLQDENNLCNLSKASALAELANLLYTCGEQERGIDVCCETILGLERWKTRGEGETGEPECRAQMTQLLVLLSDWLQASPGQPNMDLTKLNQLLALESHLEIPNSLADINNACGCMVSWEGVLSEKDHLIGGLLKVGVLECPREGQAWSRLAGWAYSWGHRAVQDRSLLASPSPSLLPAGVDSLAVTHLLTQTTSNIDLDDIEQVENLNTCETIKTQLRALGHFSEEQLDGLMELWFKSYSRVYSYYRLSSYAYFKFLQICDVQEGCERITATLRLLRLILKYALELQTVLEGGLSQTPTAPWVTIVPQLFSRLNHPEPYVRKRISELLTRIGCDSPHLIIFPAVVGSHAGASTIKDMPQTKLFSTRRELVYEIEDEGEELGGEAGDDEEEEEDGLEAEEEDQDDEEASLSEEAAVLENSFLSIVDALQKQSSNTISEVRLLVSELRRITLLWDELWLGTLGQHHADISRRFLQLDAEVKATDANTQLSQETRDHLVSEKQRLILKPLLYVFEQLQAITSVTPETPHEQWFQDNYGKEIEETLEKLREPSNPRCPAECWHLLKTLQLKLYARSCKKTAHTLNMEDISPSLAKLKETRISMPGVMSSQVVIHSVYNYVAILPTKTKPKKLVFIGSNGKLYTYLFKGLEDLHLDERIMQFLSIANTMLGDSKLRAHHYSVIPLGPRSGLISWVENVTPIFSLYKRWQQREASNITTDGSNTLMRPSDLFYSKLTPLLKEVGVNKVDPLQRKKWPLSVLKKVLLELMRSTPTHLLSKELWCQSANAGAWWQCTKLYSTSLAVMSIIGYIIGLGDRHLDNVLVNLNTGEVVHIDYNVCFEKGKTLRVPEKVPFRLTPNFRAALGVTGIEGVYRLTCENVLKVLKKGRETLLTLLEAFVYDPLIDWTPLNEAGFTGAVYGGGRELAQECKQSRRQLEREVTCSMFVVRLTEAKSQWIENKDLLKKDVQELCGLLDQWLIDDGAIRKAQLVLQERHSQMAILKEAEGQTNHSLYSLGQRYAKFMGVKAAMQNALSSLKSKIQETEMHINQYQSVLTSLRNGEVGKWLSEVQSRPKEEECMVFDLIKEFLQNAGQNQTVQQCIDCEREVGHLTSQQTQATSSLLEMLLQYGKICLHYPVSYIRKHRDILYQNWANSLLVDMTQARCIEIVEAMKVGHRESDDRLRQAALYYAGLGRQVAEARALEGRWLERLRTQGSHIQTALTQQGLNSSSSASVEPESLLAVLLSTLAQLNTRFLMMEHAARSAGDRLLDLTSRDGDWFLDDLCLISGVAVKLSTLLPPKEYPETIKTALKCIQCAHEQYKTLQEMHVNFTNIILVEAIQAMQSEDATVLEMLDRLESVVASVQLPLQDLVQQLQLHLRFTIMSMPSPHEKSSFLVEELRQGFGELVSEGGGAGDTLSKGEMLLLGFHGLFTNLSHGAANLLAHLALLLQAPNAWKNVDQIREAKSFAAPICEAGPRSVLENIFFVKSVLSMLEVLRLCRSNGEGFRSVPDSAPAPQDYESMVRPVRRYIADYISFNLLGVFSQSLAITICLLLQDSGFNVTGEVEQKDIGAHSRVPIEELCKKMIEKKGLNIGGRLSHASSVVSSAESGWKSSLLEERLGQELSMVQSRLHTLQLATTAHHWLHEHYLITSSHPPIVRAGFMLELRKTVAVVLSLQGKLKESMDTQNLLIQSAEQRLKWAAGANPALNEVLSAFEGCVETHKEKLNSEQNFALQVVGMCSAVLHHEALRTPTNEALTNDANFVTLIEDCEKSYILKKNNTTELSTAEEGLLSLLPPKKHIDTDWINKAEEKISESVRKLHNEMEPLQSTLTTTEDNLRSKATCIRGLMSKHHRIIYDTRSLLKSMLKFEDVGLIGLEEYLSRYKDYTETICRVTKSLGMSEGLNESAVKDSLSLSQILLQDTDGIYDDLLKFNVNGTCSKRPPLLRQLTVSESPRREPRDPNTGKAVQERNVYAVSVWRRVKHKLEGRDPDPGVRSTIHQQVDWVISEATNLENLSVLYEGWTPWV